MSKVFINPAARQAVYERSHGLCERCLKEPAVHVHHLTYKRAGHELPEDLQHICIVCHCAAHPEKAPEIFDWERQRQARIAASAHANVELETDEETYALDAQAEYKQEREAERESERNAWNLGGYSTSAYDLDAVEEEERQRLGYSLTDLEKRSRHA